MRNRYTVSDLYSEIDRYHVHTLYIDGVLGRIEIPCEMLCTIVQDGMSATSARANDPHMTSPWLLKVSTPGVGILRPNPGGKRNQDGTRGSVRLRLPCKSLQPGAVNGTSRARRMYQGRKPTSDAPLIERVQSVRSRQAARARTRRTICLS